MPKKNPIPQKDRKRTRIFECIDESKVDARGHLQQRLYNASRIARIHSYGFCQPGDGKMYLLAYLEIPPEDYECEVAELGGLAIGLGRGAVRGMPIPRHQIMQVITESGR